MAAPRGCPPDVAVGITAHHTHFIGSANKFKDGKGGTISVSVTKAGTLSASISAGAEVSVSDVIASAKVSVNSTITKSVAVTVGHTYSHNISSNKYGHAWYGTWGYSVDWQKTRDRPDCTQQVLDSGTAILPVKEVGWRYWETSS